MPSAVEVEDVEDAPPEQCECNNCAYWRDSDRPPNGVCLNCSASSHSYFDESFCATCREQWPYCSSCDCRFHPEDLNDDDECSDCADRYTDDDDEDGNNLVHGYSYTPSLNFHKSKDDPDQTLFMGFELEVPTYQSESVAQVIYDGPGRSEDLLYCKEDGSIEGVEIVSHPMTFDYFREHFPFYMLRSASEVGNLLNKNSIGNVYPDSGYGLHVHVSRAGFKSEAHALRWLLLIYRNAEGMAALARRQSDQWSSFSDAYACPDKAKGGKDSRRYSAVNAQNEHTFEVRVFRSTWNEVKFRAAVEFVHASVIYTRQMTAHEALRNGLKWETFREWLEGREQYAALASEIDRTYRKGEEK